MKLPTDTIEHDGKTFRISYDEYLTCGNCGESWEVTSQNDPDESHRTEPKGNTTCPACNTSHGHSYEKRAHYYTKFAAIPIEDPPLDVEPHAEALRNLADEFEALEANGWEMTQSDGVHIYFEIVETESTDSDYEVTDELE